jgi:murein DD-endopeptidase MepM/ murein hydrolase activator NlpD
MRPGRLLRVGASVTALGGLCFLGLYVGKDEPVYQAAQITVETEAPVPKVERDEFGIRQSFDVVSRRVKRNETFAEILTAHNVDYSDVVELVEVARPVFDVRSMQAGKPVRIYRDSLATTRYVVYQKDPIRYVVFDLAADSSRVFEGERPVEVTERRLSGVINNSLYATLEGSGISSRLVPTLASDLSEVFAWQIDFYRIQKGDEFSVLFEERSIDGEPIGVGDIVAARFAHMDADFYGFYFDEGEQAGYYDEEGNSLRKALLKAPLKYKRISSRYTKRRFHPVQKRYKAHLGTDYAANPGTPIRSVGDGVVLEAQYKRYNGNYVKIRHNGTYTTGYLHMSKIAKSIRPGARVKQGDVIGYVGSTGLATGPHLCYRFWKNGVQVDPLKEEIPPAHPVDAAYREAFLALRDSLMPQLFESPLQLAQTSSKGSVAAML